MSDSEAQEILKAADLVDALLQRELTPLEADQLLAAERSTVRVRP